jgi:hypothetical protein
MTIISQGRLDEAEVTRELACPPCAPCERKQGVSEAMAYNGLVQRWPEIPRLALESGRPHLEQSGWFE